MALYQYKSIDEIPGSEGFIQELNRKYGSDSFQVLNQSGLKLDVGINDSDYNKTVLDWKYINKVDNIENGISRFRLVSKPGTAPIKGYVFEQGEVRCLDGKTTQYFNVTPTKKIGLEIILENK